MPDPRTAMRAPVPPRPDLRRYDAVICDIDGCLSPETSTPFDTPALLDIAHHNHAAQTRHDRPVVTLCSGRPQPFAEAMARLLGNDSVPCIAENGVWLYHPGTNLYELDPAITPAHRAGVRDAGVWLDERYGPLGVVQQPGKSASISLFHPDTRVLHTLLPDLAPAFERFGWPLRVSMTWHYINCDLAHVSKGTGIDRFAAATALPLDRLAGVGDTPSDLAIRERVAFFACPANADERVKAVADYVSPLPEVRGVLDILSRLA